ncbi:MAG: SDR family oxidoreductase, partial [Thermoproteus sp.]|nr:SDR family oxidoreductase [Thermoproteus sp.]
CAFKLPSIMASRSSGLISSREPVTYPPADTTRPSMPPRAAAALDMAERACSYLDKSATITCRGPTAEMRPEDLDAMIDGNLKAHIFAVKAALAHLAEGASVVLISSVGGAFRAWKNHVAYVAAKAALARAVEAMAVELMPRQVRVNAVAPGGMSRDFAPGRDYKRLRRLGDPAAPPEDVAKVVLWLLGDDSSWINGAVIPVDGGRRLLQ